MIKKTYCILLIFMQILIYPQKLKINLEYNNKTNLADIIVLSDTKKCISKEIIYSMPIANKLQIVIYKNKKRVRNNYAIMSGRIPEEDSTKVKQYYNTPVGFDDCKLVDINNPLRISHKLLIYQDRNSLFTDIPCTAISCLHEYYDLKRGSSYSMQVQLKTGRKLYKSNIIKFIY